MTTFSATNHSTEVVAADRAAIWDVLTDPELLVEMTPLLRRIDTDGDLWTWHLVGIEALGVSLAPSFTERMSFVEKERIDYEHAPPDGTEERAGADGWYVLSDHEDGTLLEIEITICVDLPLPRVSRSAVERIMRRTMESTGNRFGRNLFAHLGVA